MNWNGLICSVEAHNELGYSDKDTIIVKTKQGNNFILIYILQYKTTIIKDEKKIKRYSVKTDVLFVITFLSKIYIFFKN